MIAIIGLFFSALLSGHVDHAQAFVNDAGRVIICTAQGDGHFMAPLNVLAYAECAFHATAGGYTR